MFIIIQCPELLIYWWAAVKLTESVVSFDCDREDTEVFIMANQSLFVWCFSKGSKDKTSSQKLTFHQSHLKIPLLVPWTFWLLLCTRLTLISQRFSCNNTKADLHSSMRKRFHSLAPMNVCINSDANPSWCWGNSQDQWQYWPECNKKKTSGEPDATEWHPLSHAYRVYKQMFSIK